MGDLLCFGYAARRYCDSLFQNESDQLCQKNEVTVTFEQMAGTVGSLLFLWSFIERELKDSIQALNNEELPITVHGIARSLDVWTTKMQEHSDRLTADENVTCVLVSHLREALTVRNLVCHGLIGIAAQVRLSHDEAHLTLELGDKTRILKWSELQAMLQELSQARWLIRSQTDVALDPSSGASKELSRRWKEFLKFR